MKLEILTGRVFGRLTVGECAGKKGRFYRWHCTCECGTETVVFASALRHGVTKSCGCLKFDSKPRLKHGESGRKRHSREYRIWAGMRARCLQPDNPNYQRYGARGISICDRWMEFQNFLKDMGRCPAGLSIDRINNDGNYEPGNCRWADKKTQALNRRSCHLVDTPYGKKTISQISEETGIYRGTILQRVSKRWPYERVISSPRRVS